MGTIRSQTVPVRSLDGQERDRLYRLMEADYLGMSRPAFEEDLREKEDVMLLRDRESAQIVGFSTLVVFDLPVQDAVVRAVFSGDTIVQSAFRNSFGLGIELGNYLRMVVGRYPHDTVVWLLTTKGCRTYALLPLLFREFSPRWDAATPPRHARVMDAFGARKYPAEYDPGNHLIRHAGIPQRLRPGVADVTARRLRDPHTRFFVEANPGHLHGDELVCVADAREDNWSPRLRRLVDG